MNMLKMIQRMTDIENEEKRKNLNESAVAECGDSGMPTTTSTNPGNPVTMNISLNASGKEHVDDLLNMLKAAGMDNAKPVGPEMMPMRQDMDRLGNIVRNSEIGKEELEEYDNEPEETYMDQPKGSGINRKKGAYIDAEDGDNAMGSSWGKRFEDSEDEMRESIKSKLLKSLEEKKAKPDFLDMDKDGDKKEPMKKAIKDKNKTTENQQQENKINIVRAVKYSDGKVAVKYSFKTSFGEEKTDVVVGSQSYVEKKLKDIGFRGSVSYTTPSS